MKRLEATDLILQMNAWRDYVKNEILRRATTKKLLLRSRKKQLKCLSYNEKRFRIQYSQGIFKVRSGGKQQTIYLINLKKWIKVPQKSYKGSCSEP